jgi:predicted AlkP superfamily pyrophosphatase or phosphodiesterase
MPIRHWSVRFLFAIVVVALAVMAGCARGGTSATARGGANPIVVLISFDGWRWDYIERAEVPHLRALASRGVKADGLIPSFPSKTFPNHYTLVTGLYPEHHGIVSNVIVDPGFPERFTMASQTAKTARWWGGEPLWNTAMLQGRRAASMFWPGSEAPIGGLRPTYWKPFDDAVLNEVRVAQVLEWLALPVDRQPAFITLYFSDVDTAGHAHGPDSAEVMQAAARLDRMLGDLIDGAGKLNLMDRLSVVAVSDHGMSQLSDRRIIYLDDYIDLSTVDVTEWSPNLGLTPRSGSVDAIYAALKGKHPSLAIYKREETPDHFHYRNNQRIPPILGIADDGWRIATHAMAAVDWATGRTNGGAHGYDPTLKSMHGLFVAAGPRVREGVRAPAFENIHIYNFLCALLDLKPARNDGDPSVTAGFLRPSAR